MAEPLRGTDGNLIGCMHSGCPRWATKIVAMVDEPNTLGQTHDCCSMHCRDRKRT